MKNNIHLVIGEGEVGSAIYSIVKDGRTSYSYDISKCKEAPEIKHVDVMHMCIPFSYNFLEDVSNYVHLYNPTFAVIHTTVPVGTTKIVSSCSKDTIFVHSPVRGKHPDLLSEIKGKYVKFISFDNPDDIKRVEFLARDFEDLGMTTELIADTKNTELGKLLELARYGVTLAFAKEQETICKAYGASYYNVVDKFVRTMNEGIESTLKYPEVYPFEDFVGGHCVVENMELLLKQVSIDSIPAPVLANTTLIDKGTKIWDNCKIYPSTRIGKGVSIGDACELGKDVVIGESTRIGHGTFIPEGVEIGKNVFIGPGVYFSNDLYPPSKKKNWGQTKIGDDVSIGIGAIILPGISIGDKAVIGAGSVVTKSVGAGEKWYGNPAAKHGNREDRYSMEDRKAGKKKNAS